MKGFIHPAVTAASIWSIPSAMAEKAWVLWNRRRGSDSPSVLPPDDWFPDGDSYIPPPGFDAPMRLPSWLVGWVETPSR